MNPKMYPKEWRYRDDTTEGLLRAILGELQYLNEPRRVVEAQEAEARWQERQRANGQVMKLWEPYGLPLHVAARLSRASVTPEKAKAGLEVGDVRGLGAKGIAQVRQAIAEAAG